MYNFLLLLLASPIFFYPFHHLIRNLVVMNFDGKKEVEVIFYSDCFDNKVREDEGNGNNCCCDNKVRVENSLAGHTRNDKAVVIGYCYYDDNRHLPWSCCCCFPHGPLMWWWYSR